MEFKLKDVLEIYNKRRIPLSKMDRSKQESRVYPYYGAQGIIDYVEDYIFDGKYLLIAEDGENLRSRNEDIARIVEGKFWVNNHAHILKSNNHANLYYLKYLINYMDLKPYLSGSVQPKLNLRSLKSIKIDLPHINIQNKIAYFIRSIDTKIEINNRIIANLEELAQTLFKHWFIDFEFPDENGNPYKLSGGKMTSSKVGQIPAEFSLGELESLIDIYNTRRKPLSKMERDEQEKVYPYYGATKIIDYVDDYRFNGKYILVGEDGTVKTDKGTPFTQYVTGKFWVSNHAHILKGKNISDEILLLVLNNIDIDPYITGAVQPKLSKKNLLSIEILIAPMELYKRFNAIIEPYYKKILEIEEESLLLSELRDTLLPKLMSGEIELPEALEV